MERKYRVFIINNRSGWYYILKNNEQISPTYHYSEINDIFLQKLQKIIDDIESGKYNNKKTPSEKIRMIVEEDSPVYEMSILST